MSALTSLLSDGKLAGRVFDERQVGEAVGGTPARRHALVNRALKDGSLVRVKRGTYFLGSSCRQEPIHPFALAQALSAGSYVSFETALAYHGWIPEAVYTTASVTPGRKTLDYNTPVMGRFTFHPLAIHQYQFLIGVEREKFGILTAFIASPLRALFDLIALRKERWASLDWLTTGLRVDEAHLLELTSEDFKTLKPVYKHKAVNEFLCAFELALSAIRNPSQSSAR